MTTPLIGGAGINTEGINGAPLPFTTTNPQLIFRLYAGDGTLLHTQQVTTTDPFRLPSGHKYDSFYFELEGTADVHAVYLGETSKDLKTVGV